MEFAESGIDSIGMELEFQLLDRDNLDLVDGILPLMEMCSDNRYLTPEFIQNTVEVASKKCFSIIELETHFKQVVNDLNNQTKALGMRLCAAGTHPFSTKMAHVTPKRRYLQMEETERYRSHIQITFATHVHLGMSSADDAITLLRLIRPFLPLLLAVSANSPFWHGHDTGYASYRHRVLAASRSYGMPPTFHDWETFAHFFELSQRAGMYQSINDIHWDVRPRPHLGTLEIRVMDAQSTVSDAILRAAFVQALVYYLRENHGDMDPTEYEYRYWLEKDNLYQASHLGLAAQQFDVTTQRVHVLRQRFGDILERIIEFANGSERYRQRIDLTYLEALRQQLQQPYGHELQKQWYEEQLSLHALTTRLAQRLEQDLADDLPHMANSA